MDLCTVPFGIFFRHGEHARGWSLGVALMLLASLACCYAVSTLEEVIRRRRVEPPPEPR